MDISRWIDRNADFTPDKAALCFEGSAISYAEMAERVSQAARALKHDLGIGRGDRFAYLGLNRPEMLILLFAAARLGAMMMPLNWRLAAPEHAYILHDGSAKVLFVDDDFAEHAAALEIDRDACAIVPLAGEGALASLMRNASGDDHNPHVDLSSPLLIVYTSGTTGRPKGAVLTQDAVQWNAVNSTHMHDLTAQDHVLTVLPMFHVGGLNIQTTPALHAGATVTLHARFDPSATLKAIVEDRPSLVVLVPATIQALIDHPGWATADLSALRAITTGSTIVPLALVQEVQARGLPLLQVYGSTETGPVAIYTKAADALARPGSTGKPALHCDARVIGPDGRDLPPGMPGEIVLRGPNLLYEYWGDDQATADALRGGWFHTGDVAHIDEDGCFWFTDRLKNMIISGGENIYPAELERVLSDIPGVAECSVVGRPDPRWEEVPVAVISRSDDDDGHALTRDTVLAAFEGQLARFKHPRDVVFVDALPRNVMGKIVPETVKALVLETETIP